MCLSHDAKVELFCNVVRHNRKGVFLSEIAESFQEHGISQGTLKVWLSSSVIKELERAGIRRERATYLNHSFYMGRPSCRNVSGFFYFAVPTRLGVQYSNRF
jgi:hypothetical protein